MNKKIISGLLAGVLLGVAAVGFAGCGNDSQEPNPSDTPHGTFYALEEAYENGYLTKSDLEQIAYYYNRENEAAYPDALPEKIAQAMKEDLAQENNSDEHYHGDELATADNFTIVKYLGEYHRYYVITIDSDLWSYPTMPVDYWVEVGGVRFHVVNANAVNFEVLVWKIS